MAKTPEGKVQAYGAEQLKQYGCLVRKINYEGRRGAPDYLVLVPKNFVIPTMRGGQIARTDALIVFIEFKKSADAKPEPHQLREHERMRAHGADVRVIGSKAQVDALIEELFPCR